MKNPLHKVRELLTWAPSGSASPGAYVFFETADIPLADVMQLYYRDPTCKSSVDLLAASAVKRFYTTCAPEKDYVDAAKAKQVVDDFCETVDLDGLLHDMAVHLIACGNAFWLKLSPSRLTEMLPLPDDAVWHINMDNVPGWRIPHHVTGYKVRALYAQAGAAQDVLLPEAVLHWKINPVVPAGFGVGLLQVLLHTLSVNNERRPAYAAMKAKLERLMPKVVEKYAGPDVIVGLPGANEGTIKRFETAIKNRPEEGAWLFHGHKDATVTPVVMDPRAIGFSKYIDHMINQFYLGCETPLPRLFSTPGFTEASANAALELQDMLIDPIQRMIKRRVEREIFAGIVRQGGFDSAKAGVRLNWGTPDTPEMLVADLIAAATAPVPLIRPEEFRKNAVKFGWELWDPEPSQAQGQGQGSSNQSGNER